MEFADVISRAEGVLTAQAGRPVRLGEPSRLWKRAAATCYCGAA